MRQTNRSIWATFISLALVAMLGLTFTGCEGDSNDGESDVRVTNLDNHDYVVQLRRVSDDGLIEEKNIDEGESRDFDGVADGTYYIMIIRSNGDIQDRSATFHIDDDEDAAFTINGDGNIR